MQAWTDRAPRTEYGPRALLPDAYGSRPEARKYGKGRDLDRGEEALPREMAVLCPNRIRERRKAAGFDNAMAFARRLDSIPYQRLVRIETGRVIVRESEYELVADALKIDVEALKLPVLTRSETAEWNGKWGPDNRIEEGGDHDSVLLSAYVRQLVRATGRSRTPLAKELGAPGNTLCAIWHAEKPIDRYPDTTMAVVIRLAKAESWDTVILRSRQLYDEGRLSAEIAEIHEPRVRYAPEDPDRKAPWTYEADPFRTRQPRREAATPLSAPPRVETFRERIAREKDEERRRKERDAHEYRSAVRSACAEAIEAFRTCDVHDMLERFYPSETDEDRAALARHDDLARTVIARTALMRFADDVVKKEEASAALGITIERLRQISRNSTGRMSDLLPRRFAIGGETRQ